MKKYVKPMIMYEKFELSHSIANCGFSMGHTEKDCNFDSTELPGLEGGETVFASGSCTYTKEEFLEIYEDYCLQTGSDGFNLFTS